MIYNFQVTGPPDDGASCSMVDAWRYQRQTLQIKRDDFLTNEREKLNIEMQKYEKAQNDDWFKLHLQKVGCKT